MRDSQKDILTFWFQETAPEQWFITDPAFDAEIKDRFLLTYDMACEGLGDEWSQTPDGSLALCLLFDQFPRHMFRGTARMFESDKEALAIAKNAVNRGYDAILPHEQRFFLYLPFEHSEKEVDQKRNIANFTKMERENPIALNVAQQRFDTFQKFGRFPERNQYLSRTSTPEEEAYLKSIGTNVKL